MRSGLFVVACLGLSLSAGDYPKTKVAPVTESVHGVSITDPYRWLEDQNSPETRAWIDEEVRYTKSMLDPLPQRPWLARRLGELMKTERIGMPVVRGGKYFYTKRAAEQNQFIIYMRKGLNGQEEVLVDPHPMSPDQTTSVALLGITPDGSLLTYGIRKGGEDELRVRFLDTNTRKELAYEMPRARYMGLGILADRSGVYYSKWSPEGSRVYYHAMGGGAETQDKLIFGEKYGPAQMVGAGISDDGKYLMISVEFGFGTKTELFVKDLAANGPIQPIVTGIDARFDPDFGGDRLFVTTTWKAPNGRALVIDLKDPAQEKWREIIPERESRLQGLTAVGGMVAATYLENVSSKIRLYTPDGKPVREITLPGIGSAGGPSGTWTSEEAFYQFTSFAQAPIIYRYDMATGGQNVWARTQIPFDSSRIDVEQVWYTSKDKTRIPMFLVHKKGLKLDGNRPVFLTGYGGFDLSETPNFSAIAAIWSEMDGVFALPNLRGGGEFGEKWHKAGMFGNKQNVFDDFIGAAEYLIEKGYTNPKRLAIEGGSNGGLLVGAAMTQRPDLYQAVICAVPLLDMVRYHMFKVAKFWVPEYGSSEDPEQFKYLYAYSPYHHVKSGTKYPAVLFVSGDSDTRVDPLHARKMAALMQASTDSDRPILLHYDTKAGHAGGKPVSRQIEDTTDELAFLMWQLGMKPPGAETIRP